MPLAVSVVDSGHRVVTEGSSGPKEQFGPSRRFGRFVEQIWDDRLGRRRELMWDDRIGDFNLNLRPCAHPGCPDLAGADLDGNPPPVRIDELGRIVRSWFDGDPVWCWYHASPMWVKRRQRAKAKSA
jgi:hypothetical protein